MRDSKTLHPSHRMYYKRRKREGDNIGSRAACICRDSFSIEMERGRREWLLYKDQQYTYYTEGLKDLFIFIRRVLSRLPLFNTSVNHFLCQSPNYHYVYIFLIYTTLPTYKKKVPKLSCEKSNFQQIYTYRDLSASSLFEV